MLKRLIHRRKQTALFYNLERRNEFLYPEIIGCFNNARNFLRELVLLSVDIIHVTVKVRGPVNLGIPTNSSICRCEALPVRNIL